VSVEAISWALNLAPVPADRGGQPSSACKFVLVGLANHAGHDGTGGLPSVATLVRYTGLSERTIRTSLRRPPRFAISHDAVRVDGGEWCRAAVIETQTEPRPGREPGMTGFLPVLQWADPAFARA
jgi:hypothetical protein